jgi:Flp pilus assembly protein TadD
MGFHRLKASVALGLGDSRTAASEMEKALTLKPADTGLAMAAAVAELQSKNAKRAANLAAPVYSQTRNPQVGLIVLQAELESHADFHPTLDSLRATLLPASEQLAFRQHLAALLISHREIADAITELQAAASFDPSRADLQYNLALAQFQAGRPDEAENSASKCKDLGDDADLESLIGDIEEARGKNLEAVKSYQAAVGLAPNEEKYRLSLAVELIRHSNLDAARVVLQQAQALQPNSWRIELALGMVEYFAGTDDDATRYLLRAYDLSPEPENALQYLGDVQMDRASAPDPAVLAKLCEYSDQHPKDGRMQYYCGAVSFRRDYVTSDKSHAVEILKHLHASETLLPKDPSPHCQLGKTYRWLERWSDALTETKICARLDPDSADAHYRLAQIYQHLGQSAESQSERNLYEAASTKVADENAHREAAMKTFIYTMQNRTADQK